MNEPKKKGVDLSGLAGFNMSSLAKKGAPTESNGQPLMLRHSDVIPDVTQPRKKNNPGFTKESLTAFGAELKAEGIKSPLSVKPKNADGKYVINDGERRWRGAAPEFGNLEFVPAFIDEKFDSYNQVKANHEREALTPMEMAIFIREKEEAGDSRAVIAKRLGMSASLITQYASLLSMPEQVRELYDTERCRDVLALYELTNIAKKDADAVTRFLKKDDVTRQSILKLKADLKETKAAAALLASGSGEQPAESGRRQSQQEAAGGVSPSSDSPIVGGGDSLPPGSISQAPGTSGSEGAVAKSVDQPKDGLKASAETGKEHKESASKLPPATVMVKYKEVLHVLRTDLQPTMMHVGWIMRPSDESSLKEVELSDVQLDSIITN